MNEQLIVKNFGPIKDATVDFKRVTVFIGPTGGGKSTLAKLAATVKQGDMIDFGTSDAGGSLSKLGIESYMIEKESFIDWKLSNGLSFCIDNTKEPIENNDLEIHTVLEEDYESNKEQYKAEMNIELNNYLLSPKGKALPTSLVENIKFNFDNAIKRMIRESMIKTLFPSTPHYIPAERILLSSIGQSWSGIIRDDIGLPKLLVEFANSFSTARKSIKNVKIPFLSVRYSHEDNQDLIESTELNKVFNLHETASGVQSVTPLLVLIEYLSSDTEQTQSFIIEEPELNLYPTAQQGLLNWLVEKCTKGENDLTITTHSPYLLAHFNTLLFAYQVAQNHPERADEIAKIVPRESWLDPKEFAAYHVEGQKENGVRSIINPETGLISYNGLDAIASAEA
ncbi:MAG: hypothetical protein EOP45_19555, partial [Sphingobacteriaceae bacterium]